MIREEIKKEIIAAIRNKFGEIEIPEFSPEIPENPQHGNYASNISLVLAKTLKKNPLEIAKMLEADIKNRRSWDVKTATPGFLNFKISENIMTKELQKILSEKQKYGNGKKKKEKIQLEYISANPTGPLTLANGRGGFLGDTLARVLLQEGYAIEREYYVNDTGNQILTLGKSLLAAQGLIPEEEKFYKGSYVKKWASTRASLIKKHKDRPLDLGKLAAKDFLKSIKKAVKLAKITFDRYTSEDLLHKKSFVKKALQFFEKQNSTYTKDGATWLKTTEHGDDKDRVLITSDNFPTYFLADAGHYLETQKRGFHVKINILGPDHYGYVARIQAAAKIIGIKKSIIIITQAIRIISQGKEVRMSKRKGEFITFQELVEEVPVDVARFFFLEKSSDTHIDFDLDLAKEQSNKNPVYYVQYAHARISSILRKAETSNRKLRTANFKLLSTAEEQALIRKLIQFPEITADTSEDFQVHRIPRYALELARTFHNFYEKCRVISDDKNLTTARLSLVQATQIILKNTLTLLNIDAPEKM